MTILGQCSYLHEVEQSCFIVEDIRQENFPTGEDIDLVFDIRRTLTEGREVPEIIKDKGNHPFRIWKYQKVADESYKNIYGTNYLSSCDITGKPSQFLEMRPLYSKLCDNYAYHCRAQQCDQCSHTCDQRLVTKTSVAIAELRLDFT